MDNEFADLETELKQLRPRAAGTDLETELAQSLDGSAAPKWTDSRQRARSPAYPTATTWTSWKWGNWGVAAALVAVMAGWSSLAPSVQSSIDAQSIALSEADGGEPVLRPVRAGRTLLASRMDGIVELADGSTAQRVRDYYVDTIVWRDPAGRSQLKWEVPREAVRFVGLAAY
jgi:hypothetical protein